MVSPVFLREVLRHYDEFREHIAHNGDPVITDPKTGESICFYDIKRGWEFLTEKQRMAIYYWVICDMTEVEAAKAMGYDTTKGTSHIRDYAMTGLAKMARFHG